MTAFDEALRILRERIVRGERTETVDLAAAAGYVLAEEIVSDIDMPPFDRAMMDGFAFRRAGVEAGASLRIAGSIAAGDRPGPPLREGECTRIMTGAPLPEGAETVIPVENAEEEGETVRLALLPPPGAHVSPKGEDIRAGERVLAEGSLLGPQEIGVLAAVGRPAVRIWAPPRVAFASTGDELTEPGEALGPARIRNSNAYTIHTQIIYARGIPRYLGIVRDEELELRKKIDEGLTCDLLLFSGGVSKGKRDLVPALLEAGGVRILFRRIDVKPGYPTLFGVRGSTLVYGLPGNPIAALFGFELYVRPAIRAFFHHPRPEPARLRGELAAGIPKKPGRTALVPCLAEWAETKFIVTPVRTHGSADIFAVAGADSIAIVPPERGDLEKGEAVAFCRMGGR